MAVGSRRPTAARCVVVEDNGGPSRVTGLSAAASPWVAAGFTHRTCRPDEGAVRPKRLLEGGGWSKVEYAITQPGRVDVGAGRDVAERAADGLAHGNGDVAAQDDGRHQPGPDAGIVVDLVLQQLDEDPGALRVADDSHPAPVVVLGEVGLPQR